MHFLWSPRDGLIIQAQQFECHFPSAACRRPVYSLRVNRLRVTMEELQQRLRDSDVECEPSPFLPNDFLRVLCAASLHPSLHMRPASYCDAQQRACGRGPSLLGCKACASDTVLRAADGS